MATLTVRDFDDGLKAELRVMAARHGRSMEAEIREILRIAITRSASTVGMGTRIHELFADADGPVPVPSRTELPRAVEFPE